MLDVTRGAVKMQSGYVYHYAFAMLIGVLILATWFVGDGRCAVSHLLSIITFLPLAGALIILALRGNSPAVARNARWIALIFTIADFLLTLVLWAKFDAGRRPRSSSSSMRAG